MGMNVDEKAKLYDTLLIEHDKLASQVRNIEISFNPTKEEQEKIKVLKKQMGEIERRANSLVGDFYGK